ncbi:MAG TPA: nucleotidyltransferase family protein [Herpetosiphonaceae bacterium]
MSDRMDRLQADFTFETLSRLLLTERDWEQARRAVDVFRQRPALLQRFLDNPKTVSIVYHNLIEASTRWPGSVAAEALEQLKAMCDDRIGRRDASFDEMLEIVVAARRELGIEILLIKGYSVGRFYPAPYERLTNDVDFMFRTVEDAYVFYEWMIDQGYTQHEKEISWFKQDAAGRVYGQINLLNVKQRHRLRFDVHYTYYSIGYSGYLDEDLWQHALPVTVRGVELLVLKPSYALIILFAHLLSHGYVLVKDVNDVAAILLNARLDWNEVASLAARSHLDGIMRHVIQRVAALYDHPTIQAQARQALKVLRSARHTRLWRFYRRSRYLRAAVNAIYNYQAERSRTGKRWHSLQGAFECLVYYTRSFDLALRPRTRQERLALALISTPKLLAGGVTPRTCVRLYELAAVEGLAEPPRLPVAQHTYGQGRLVYVEDEHVGLILSNRHAYLPTIDYILDPRQIEAGRALVRQLVAAREAIREAV